LLIFCIYSTRATCDLFCVGHRSTRVKGHLLSVNVYLTMVRFFTTEVKGNSTIAWWHPMDVNDCLTNVNVNPMNVSEDNPTKLKLCRTVQTPGSFQIIIRVVMGHK
jgi:hypothetical protein